MKLLAIIKSNLIQLGIHGNFNLPHTTTTTSLFCCSNANLSQINASQCYQTKLKPVVKKNKRLNQKTKNVKRVRFDFDEKKPSTSSSSSSHNHQHYQKRKFQSHKSSVSFNCYCKLYI